MKVTRIFAAVAVILAIGLSGCTTDGSTTNKSNTTSTTRPSSGSY